MVQLGFDRNWPKMIVGEFVDRSAGKPPALEQLSYMYMYMNRTARGQTTVTSQIRDNYVRSATELRII